MNIFEIPFFKKVGLQQDADGNLMLDGDVSYHNHLGTIHASALFTLVEAASGAGLMQQFPELLGKVAPVVRDSHIKFKKPAKTAVTAYPSISDEAVEKFKRQFERKNRAPITVDVVAKDTNGTVVCIGSFHWFIQGIE